MQPDSELFALKPQWLPNKKGVSTSSVFSLGGKADPSHHIDNDRPHASYLKAPPPRHYSSNNHSSSSHPSSPLPTSASSSSSSAAPRSNFFSSSRSDTHAPPHHTASHPTPFQPSSSSSSSQRDAAPSWKPNTPPASALSSPLLAAPTAPHPLPPAPPVPSAPPPRALAQVPNLSRRTDDPNEAFTTTRLHSTSNSRSDPASTQPPPQVRPAPAANPPLVEAPRGASSSTWTHGPVASKPAATTHAPDAGRGAPHQRPQSALIDPPSSAAHPAASGQAVYQKVVFEKEFPSLKDSKLPLGYAPKEAPYKQTFLSSRVTGNWTSKLADAPAALPEAAAAPGALHATSVNGGAGSAPAAASGSRVGASSSGGLGDGSGSLGLMVGSGPGSASAPIGTSGWGSFAHAAGTSGAGSAAGAAGAAAASSVLSTEKLREQLAVKQSKQLIPVIARKDDGVSSAGRGRQPPASASGGSRGAGAGTSKPAAPSAPAPLVLASGKMLLSSSGPAALSNGTVMLAKRTAAPLHRPLLMAGAAAPATTTAQAPPPPQQQQQQQQATCGVPAHVHISPENAPLLPAHPPTQVTPETAPSRSPGPASTAPTQDCAGSGGAAAGGPTAGLSAATEVSRAACPSDAAASRCSHEVSVLDQVAYSVAGSENGVDDGLGSAAAVLLPLVAPCPDENGGLLDEAEDLEQDRMELAELASYLPGDLLAAPSEHPHYQQVQQQQQQQAAAVSAQPAPKFLVSSEEEAFLRSLGWSDADDETDDVLSEEEIAAFRASTQARFFKEGSALAAVGRVLAEAPTGRLGAGTEAPLPLGPRWGSDVYGVSDVAKSVGPQVAGSVAQGCGAQAVPPGGARLVKGAGQPGWRAGVHAALPASADAAAYAARCSRVAAVAVAHSFGSEVSMTDSEEL